MKYLKILEKIAKGELPDSPAANTIGFHVKEVEFGRVVVELEVTERLHNPVGTLHGGIICDIADAAMGYAFGTTLSDDELSTTIEIKVNFLRPVFNSILRAEGKLIKKGALIGLLECYVTDEENNIVAHATSTCMVIDGTTSGKRERKE